MIRKDLVIIGGGPAGLAAAVAAWDAGVRDLVVIERDSALGGILKQCIHNGFGLHRFGEELTGPEYARRYIDMAEERGIPSRVNAMVLDIAPDKVITLSSPERGVEQIQARAVILAMGCRERSRGALRIPGSRPAGVFTAGTAQRYLNIKGMMPGKDVVILGSGDIGLIMARRMTLEGARVRMVCELMPYSGGLTRNIVQCLEDYGIPLKLSHTVTKIHGEKRVTGVTVSQVDERLQPIPGTETFVPCDTLLLSCGLIPENELSLSMGIKMDPVTGGAAVDQYRQTAIKGVFACGNVLHVHDLVDFVSQESELAGRSAAAYLKDGLTEDVCVPVSAGRGVRYAVPQVVNDLSRPVTLFLRTDKVYRDAYLCVSGKEGVVRRLRARRLTPGEMASIPLTPDMLKAAKGALTVSVKEE